MKQLFLFPLLLVSSSLMAICDDCALRPQTDQQLEQVQKTQQEIKKNQSIINMALTLLVSARVIPSEKGYPLFIAKKCIEKVAVKEIATRHIIPNAEKMVKVPCPYLGKVTLICEDEFYELISALVYVGLNGGTSRDLRATCWLTLLREKCMRMGTWIFAKYEKHPSIEMIKEHWLAKSCALESLRFCIDWLLGNPTVEDQYFYTNEPPGRLHNYAAIEMNGGSHFRDSSQDRLN